jgi:hypothetical protein
MSLRLQRKCEKYALGKHIMGYTAVTTAIYCRLGSVLNVCVSQRLCQSNYFTSDHYRSGRPIVTCPAKVYSSTLHK